MPAWVINFKYIFHKKIPISKKNYLWRVVAERSSALDSSSGVFDQQTVGSNPSLVLKQDTYCFVLRMGRKAIGPVCYSHKKNIDTIIAKEFARVLMAVVQLNATHHLVNHLHKRVLKFNNLKKTVWKKVMKNTLSRM